MRAHMPDVHLSTLTCYKAKTINTSSIITSSLSMYLESI